MKKLLYSMAVIGAMFCTACDHYDHAIADQGDRLDILEQSTIKNIDDQVDAITTSLGELETVHSELSTLVETLKNSDTDKTNLITALQAKDEDILKAIADLKKYVDDEISATEDWATATFATLDQYTALQKELSDLSSLVKQYGTELTSVKTAVESLTASVSTLETSMKEWVNKTLADGYYDIATIDTKLDALKKEISDADEALAKKIDDQKAALEQAQKDLTEAYEKAITEAIETNNGVISKQIADAVEDVMDKVDLKLAVIDNTIAAIQKDIEALNDEIATIKEQIEAINESLKSLEDVDEELEALIEALKATDEDNAKLIEALQAKDAELDEAIAELKKYVDDEISDTEDWVNVTFATLEQYTELQTVVSGIEATIEQQGTDLAGVQTAVETLTASISTLETSMKEWVNQTLEEGYYDIAEINAFVEALELQIESLILVDEALAEGLAKQIEDQKAALKELNLSLTSAYKDAIKKAIEKNNGLITQEIADAIQAATGNIDTELQTINSTITTITAKLEELEEALANLINRIQSIRFLPEYSDGKVLLNNETSLTFIVSPKEAAAAIAEAAQDNAEVVTAYVSRTMARTKAVDMPTTLTVTSVNGNAEGILEVGVSDANLPDDFWKDLNEGNIYISISDGNNDVLSELIPILPMSYIATPTDFIQALNAAKATGDVVRLSSDIVLETPVTLSTGDALTIDLNGHTLSTESTNNSGNFDLFLVNGANLTIKNGTITTKHVGADMGWSAMTTAFDVTAGGVLNIENATIKNLGGSSMSFCVHLNNWGEVTLNINNSTLESTYIPVRVFNSGPQMNNVTINNSKLTGKYCFWVHNYKPAGDTVGDAANLNFDIYNGTNEFENTGKSPVLYGFTNAIYFDQNGNEYVSDGVIKDADGNYHISNVAGLNWVAEQVNTMEYYVSAAANILDEKTVYLDNDIDCNGAELTPIGDYAFSRTIFRGVFDGQNHTISNFKITEKTQWEQKVTEASYGLFGNMNGTVKNLIVMGAAVKPDGGRYSAALVGRFGGGLIENCHVKNSSVEISHWQVGGLVGQWNDGKIINCSVTNVQVTGYAAVGALVGMALTKGERFIENCEVAGCDLIQNGTFGESYDSMFGLILGSENADDLTVNISGCSLSNNTIKGDASTTIYGDGDGVNIIN